MKAHHLQLNLAKTEPVVFPSQPYVARNLGVRLDDQLDDHGYFLPQLLQQPSNEPHSKCCKTSTDAPEAACLVFI